jgi:hypothetical protein
MRQHHTTQQAILGLLLALGLAISPQAIVQSSTPIGALYGANVACDPAIATCTPIPLAVSILCTVSCPLRVSPSYASGTEFWAASGSGAGNCARSTDGGATWPACTTQPSTTSQNELYAGASDGSVVVVMRENGPTRCDIRRSPDNGATWPLVFTQAVNCDVGSIEGQYLYCLADGRCEAAMNTANTFRIYRSTDNGQSWLAGETGSASCGTSAGAAWDGSNGIIPSENPGCGGGNLATAFFSTADSYAVSTAWTGAQGDCWGQVIYNGTARAICQGSVATPDNRYSLRSSTGALVASLTLPGALLTSIDAGGLALAPFTNVLYILATRATDAGIYVSQDNLASFNLIGTLGAGVTVRGGNMFYSGGCIYIAGGITRRFAKICR